METKTFILDTHYSVVRYLYDNIFKKRKNQINDLQNQELYLKCINKYLLCRSGQYAHLYNLYTSFTRKEILDYYETNRLKMNSSTNEWLNFTITIKSPGIIPQTVDGPYTIDNMALRRYAYFWGERYNLTSNILATPFYCLDGIEHLYYEFIKWKTMLENYKSIQMRIDSKHIFHENFYIIHFMEIKKQQPGINIRFLIWLDDIDVQTELYVRNDDDDISLLKRLYIACDDRAFMEDLSNVNKTRSELIFLNMFINNLSSNFVVTFNGKPPRRNNTIVLDVTNNISDAGQSKTLNFMEINRNGFHADRVDQIYTIERMSELHTMSIQTPNFIVFQEQITVSTRPTINEMNTKFQEFLFFLSLGMLDRNIFVRMFMFPETTINTYPNSMKKQLTVIYMQKYRKFSISRETVDYDTTFYDKTYVFSARNLVCTVKSIKYLIRDVIQSSPLLPACAMIVHSMDNEILTWQRITQNIVYFKRTHTICFLNNFTLQKMNNSRSDEDFAEFKTIEIVTDNLIFDELNHLFNINNYEIKTIATFIDIDLKCVTINNSLNFEIFYFSKNLNNNSYENENFKNFFNRFMYTNEFKQSLNDKILTIFIHLYNLFNNNILL